MVGVGLSRCKETVPGETQATWEGGAVSASPLPVSPTPRGDSPSTQCQGTDPLSAVNVNTLPKSCLCPRALYPDYRQTLPAPSGGGGRRRGTRRAVEVVRRKDVHPETQETWEGGVVSASPLPVSLTPTGRFSIDTVPRGTSRSLSSM